MAAPGTTDTGSASLPNRLGSGDSGVVSKRLPLSRSASINPSTMRSAATVPAALTKGTSPVRASSQGRTTAPARSGANSTAANPTSPTPSTRRGRNIG